MATSRASPATAAIYNDNRLVGSSATTAQSNFDPQARLYRAIAAMAAIRRSDPALSRGEQVVRAYGDSPGLFALSRRSPSGGGETLALFNSSTEPLTASVIVD